MKNECLNAATAVLDEECVRALFGNLRMRQEGLEAYPNGAELREASVWFEGYVLELLNKAASAALHGDKNTVRAIMAGPEFADRHVLRWLVYSAMATAARSEKQPTLEDQAKALFSSRHAELLPHATMLGSERPIPGAKSQVRVDFLLSCAGENIPVEVKGAARLRDTYQLQEYIDLAGASYGYLVAAAFHEETLRKVWTSKGQYVAILADVTGGHLTLVGAP